MEDLLMLFLFLLLVEYIVVGASDFLVFLLLFIFTLNHAPFNSIISNRIKNIQPPHHIYFKLRDCANFSPNKIAFLRSCSVGTKHTLNFSSNTDSFIEYM